MNTRTHARLPEPFSSRLLAALTLALALVALPAIATADEPPLDPAGIDRANPVDPDGILALERVITGCVNRVRPAVVGLLFDGGGGSGTIISSDGYVLTAGHVTRQPNRRCVVVLADGSQFDGTTLGLHSAQDYGLVKFDPGERELPWVELGDSDTVDVGQWIVSMGHPLGTELHPFRPPVVRVGRVYHTHELQLRSDAPLISGDSGGPMFDLSGRLIGINVSINRSVLVNNTTPVNRAKEGMEQMKAGEHLGGAAASQQVQRLAQAVNLLLRQNRFAQAEEKLNELVEMAPGHALPHYMFARLYASWTRTDAARRDELVSKAIDHIERAVELGFNSVPHLSQDRALRPLFQEDRFFRVICRLQAELGAQPVLGIVTQDNPAGVTVTRIQPLLSGARAGVQAGDVVTSFNGRLTPDVASLNDAVGELAPGDEAMLEIERDGDEIALLVIVAGHGPSMPNPQTSGVYRSDNAFRGLWVDACTPAGESVVSVLRSNRAIGFGVVVGDGLVLVKSSILGDRRAITLRTADGRTGDAAHIAHDPGTDLALLRTSLGGLQTVTWADSSDGAIGGWLACVGAGGQPFAVGVRSLGEYVADMASERPFLGVGVGRDAPDLSAHGYEGGIVVTEVHDGSGAEKAGIESGDVIVEIDGRAATNASMLIRAIQLHQIGDTLKLTVVRDDEVLEIDAVLGKRDAPDQQRRRNPLAGPVNRRADGFGRVVQHDAVVLPTQTGSLLVNAEGEVVGVNIARADRTKNYAIPVEVLADVVPRLIAASQQVRDYEEDF